MVHGRVLQRQEYFFRRLLIIGLFIIALNVAVNYNRKVCYSSRPIINTPSLRTAFSIPRIASCPLPLGARAIHRCIDIVVEEKLPPFLASLLPPLHPQVHGFVGIVVVLGLVAHFHLL